MRARALLGAALVLAVVAWTGAPALDGAQAEPDDFRFLAAVQELRAGRVGVLDASVVENGWDHLWWIDAGGTVRFFRPLVLASFYLDDLLWGSSPTGMAWTNLALHAACSVLVWLLLRRVVGAGWPALAGGVLFAALACHAEALWYFSGRNASLLALFSVAAYLAHVAGERRPWVRAFELLAWALALLAKETALVLPLVLLAHDRYASRGATGFVPAFRRRWRLWLAYLVVGGAFLAVRGIVLARHGGSDLVEPYFVPPWSERFVPHLLTQLWTYGENLAWSGITKPFLEAGELGAPYTSVLGLVLAFVLAAALGAVAVSCVRARPLAALGLLAWLPASFVYVSERYLYLPSVGIAGLAAFWVLLVRRRRGLQWVVLAVALGWAANQGRILREKLVFLNGYPRAAQALYGAMAPLHEEIARRPRLLLVDFPGDELHAQFVERQLRVHARDPDLRCLVLTTLPEQDPRAAPTFVGEHALRIEGEGPILRRGGPLPRTKLAAGVRVQRAALPFEVVVERVRDGACVAARFELRSPLDRWLVVRFVPRPDLRGLDRRGPLIATGRFEIVRP